MMTYDDIQSIVCIILINYSNYLIAAHTGRDQVGCLILWW